VNDLRPAGEYDIARLAALFTAAYEGYYVPFAISESTLRYMVDAYQLDLGASRVALLGDETVGLANLGVRGDRGWIGGIGVIPSARRRGIARALMEAVLDEARRLELAEVWLEVLERNEPAYRLYEQLGFRTTRDVDVWVLDGMEGEGRGSAWEVPLDAACARVRELRASPEPWQRADETLEYMRGLDPPLRGLRTDGAVAIYRAAPQAISLVQIAGDEEDTADLLTSLRAEGTINALNLPAGEAAADAMHTLGGRIAARQHEMRLTL
jgi:ribosomal protein S18 acetylase RimI-like enzyme